MVKICGFKNDMSVSDMFFILSAVANSNDKELFLELDGEGEKNCCITSEYYYTKFSINILKAHLKALLAVSNELRSKKKETTEAILELRKNLSTIAYQLGNAGLDSTSKISYLVPRIGDNFYGNQYVRLIENMKALREQIECFEQDNIEEVANYPSAKLAIVKVIEDKAESWNERMGKALLLLHKLEDLEEEGNFMGITDVQHDIQNFFEDEGANMEIPDNEELYRFYTERVAKEAGNYGIDYNELIAHKALYPDGLWKLYNFKRHQQMYVDVRTILDAQEYVVDAIDKIAQFKNEHLILVSSAGKKTNIEAIKKQMNEGNTSEKNMDDIIIRQIITAKHFLDIFYTRIKKYGIFDKKIKAEDAHNDRSWFYNLVIDDVINKKCFQLLKIKNFEEAVENDEDLEIEYGYDVDSDGIPFQFIHNLLINKAEAISKLFDNDYEFGINVVDSIDCNFLKGEKNLKQHFPAVLYDADFDDFVNGNIKFFEEPMLGIEEVEDEPDEEVDEENDEDEEDDE